MVVSSPWRLWFVQHDAHFDWLAGDLTVWGERPAVTKLFEKLIALKVGLVSVRDGPDRFKLWLSLMCRTQRQSTGMRSGCVDGNP